MRKGGFILAFSPKYANLLFSSLVKGVSFSISTFIMLPGAAKDKGFRISRAPVDLFGRFNGAQINSIGNCIVAAYFINSKQQHPPALKLIPVQFRSGVNGFDAMRHAGVEKSYIPHIAYFVGINPFAVFSVNIRP